MMQVQEMDPFQKRMRKKPFLLKHNTIAIKAKYRFSVFSVSNVFI